MWIGIFLFLSALFTAYLWLNKRMGYWRDRGVPYIQPWFPYGTLKIKGRQLHSGEVNKIYYNQMKGKTPLCGLFFNISPSVLITDINLVKQILIKDFQYFHDRGFFFNEKDDPLSAHLFNLEGDRWKTLRAKITPVFTSGKMKYMFPTMAKVGNEFIDALNNEKDLTKVDVKEYFARFTTDVIGTCAFGLECNSLKDPNAEFRQMGMRHFHQPRNNRAKIVLLLNFKTFFRMLGAKNVRDDVSKFFRGVVKSTVEYREKNNVQRNDYMDLLLKIKSEGQLSLDEVAAECFVFFLAGFETSSTASSYALYELALNQEIQDKARKSVNDALQKHGGEFTYEAVNEMHYIEYCINGKTSVHSMARRRLYQACIVITCN